MKRNGIYSASIALIAVAIITALAFNSIATVKSQESRSLAREIVEVKWAFQNAENLARKTSADALADGTAATGPGSCTVSDAKVGQYLTDTFADVDQDLSCRVTGSPTVILAPPGPGPGVPADVTITLTLVCDRHLGTGFVNYEKTLVIQKTVTPHDDGSSCLVDIEDLDLTECEVDGIPTGPDSSCDIP